MINSKKLNFVSQKLISFLYYQKTKHFIQINKKKYSKVNKSSQTGFEPAWPKTIALAGQPVNHSGTVTYKLLNKLVKLKNSLKEPQFF